MNKTEIKGDSLSHKSHIKSCTCNYKYFSINLENKPFCLPIWISEKELQELITIQKQIKAEFGIKKPLIEIGSRVLEISLNETVKTCNIGCGE